MNTPSATSHSLTSTPSARWPRISARRTSGYVPIARRAPLTSQATPSITTYDPNVDDSTAVAVNYLARDLLERGCTIAGAFEVRHKATGKSHAVLVLGTGELVCDCGTPTNLGLPCRHNFATHIAGVPFSMKQICQRCV